MSGNEKFESEQWLKDLVYRCANIGVIREDLQQIYGQTQLPSNKSSNNQQLKNQKSKNQKKTNKQTKKQRLASF